MTEHIFANLDEALQYAANIFAPEEDNRWQMADCAVLLLAQFGSGIRTSLAATWAWTVRQVDYLIEVVQAFPPGNRDISHDFGWHKTVYLVAHDERWQTPQNPQGLSLLFAGMTQARIHALVNLVHQDSITLQEAIARYGEMGMRDLAARVKPAKRCGICMYWNMADTGPWRRCTAETLVTLMATNDSPEQIRPGDGCLVDIWTTWLAVCRGWQRKEGKG